MLALCSISQQGNQEKVGEEATQQLQIDALPEMLYSAQSLPKDATGQNTVCLLSIGLWA